MNMSSQITKVIDLVPGAVKSLPVLQADQLTPEVFWREHVCKHRPVIIKGGAAHWPAISKWPEPGYLESVPSAMKVQFTCTFNPMPANVLKHVTQQRGISDGLQEMRSAPEDGVYSMPAVRVPPEWDGDFGDYHFMPKNLAKMPKNYPGKRLFIYRNASTEWHYHTMDETLTTQLVGTKQISLLRLDSSNWTDFKNVIESNLHHLSFGKLFFPKNGPIKYEGVIDAGDIVYIPPFWWHGVDPHDSKVGATLAFCFRTPLERFGYWRDPATRSILPSRLREFHRTILLSAKITLSSMIRSFKGTKWYEDI